KTQTFRILLSLAAHNNLTLEQWDVQSAYLEAKIDQATFIRPPAGVETQGVFRLNKALYGLRRAGKLWNETLHKELIGSGLQQSQEDPCLYFKHTDTSIIMLLVYVDDILTAH